MARRHDFGRPQNEEMMHFRVTAQVAAIPGEATLGRNDVKVGRPGDGLDEDFG
jgi:hypothetical protein